MPVHPQTKPAPVIRDAAWRNNPAWIQLLGLCPLLAVSTSVANALGLALASSFVLVGSSALVALTRSVIATHLRLPARWNHKVRITATAP